MKLYFIIVLSLLITTCQKQTKNPEYSYHDFIVSEIMLDTDSLDYTHSIKKIITIKDNEYLSCLNKKTAALTIYETTKFTLITAKTNFPRVKQIEDYYIHNFDSIYTLYNDKDNELTLMDSAFKIKKTYNTNAYSTEFGEHYTLSSVNYYDPLLVVDGIAFVTHYPTYVLNNKHIVSEYYNKRIGISILLNDNPLIIDYGCKFPADYSKKTYRAYRPYRLFTSSNEIYSFEANDSIFIKSIEGVFTKKLLKSNHFYNHNEFDYTDLSFNNILKYAIINSSYGSFLYDKYRRRYYRVCIHRLNYENKDGSINTYGDKNWSIVVTDENFNVIKEVLFPSTYSFTNIFITKEGVLINKYTNHEKIVFDIFNF